MTLKAYY